MTHQAFEYLEIRAAVDTGEETHSFLGTLEADGYGNKICKPDSAKAEAEAYLAKHGGKMFWTIYGVRPGNTVAIGDFTTFEAAYDVLVGLCLPMRQAIDLIDNGKHSGKAMAVLEDFCNQSSNEERL